MNDELTQAQKDALERFKETKDDPNTFSGFFYRLLASADPNVKELMEKKAAILMHAGYEIGREMSEAEDDPVKRAAYANKLQQLAIKINSSVKSKKTNDAPEE